MGGGTRSESGQIQGPSDGHFAAAIAEYFEHSTIMFADLAGFAT